MQALWWWSKTETCRSDIYVYFNVNFNVFKIKKCICWWVKSTYIKMHGATIKIKRDGLCSLRGTSWIFKFVLLILVSKIFTFLSLFHRLYCAGCFKGTGRFHVPLVWSSLTVKVQVTKCLLLSPTLGEISIFWRLSL